MYHVNENIEKTRRVFPEQQRYGSYRYDMNENPEGLPRSFVDRVVSEITPEFLSIYPEPDVFQAKYAKYLGLPPENVMATNGSDMAIRYLLETFGEPGKKVVTVSPTFEMYWVNCSILGYEHCPVSYNDDLTIDVGRIVGSIDEDVRVVVLLNPNNPVGDVFSIREIESVVRRAYDVGAVVIIDEAYHYFYEGTCLDLIQRYDNVAILRTFSKLFSIAALRLGVIISNAKLIEYVKRSKLTFDVNSVALLFGERLLDFPEIEKKLIEEEEAGKAYLLSSLEGHGYRTRNSHGNFIFILPRTDAHDVALRLKENHGVLVKTFGGGILKDMLRVSTGSIESMKRFLSAFYEEDLPHS